MGRIGRLGYLLGSRIGHHGLVVKAGIGVYPSLAVESLQAVCRSTAMGVVLNGNVDERVVSHRGPRLLLCQHGQQRMQCLPLAPARRCCSGKHIQYGVGSVVEPGFQLHQLVHRMLIVSPYKEGDKKEQHGNGCEYVSHRTLLHQLIQYYQSASDSAKVAITYQDAKQIGKNYELR